MHWRRATKFHDARFNSSNSLLVKEKRKYNPTYLHTYNLLGPSSSPPPQIPLSEKPPCLITLFVFSWFVCFPTVAMTTWVSELTWSARLSPEGHRAHFPFQRPLFFCAIVKG